MATEFELQERRRIATEKYEEYMEYLGQFMTGAANETVALPGGDPIRTLRGIVGELENSAGALTEHIQDVNEFLTQVTGAMDELP